MRVDSERLLDIMKAVTNETNTLRLMNVHPHRSMVKRTIINNDIFVINTYQALRTYTNASGYPTARRISAVIKAASSNCNTLRMPAFIKLRPLGANQYAYIH